MSKYFSAGSKFRDEFGIEYILVYIDDFRYTLVMTNGTLAGHFTIPIVSFREPDKVTHAFIRNMIGYHTYEVITSV